MKVSMISTLPPTKGLSPYTLGLVSTLSKECEIDFYGFKSIYPEFLYPGGTKTNDPEPIIKNVKIHNDLTWYNPLSWIKVGFSINTNTIHAQWWSWFLAPIYIIVLSIAKLRGKRVIMTIHNVKPHEKSFIKNFLNNSVIGLADRYIVHSEHNKRLFLENRRTKKAIYVIAHGIIKLDSSSKTNQELRSKYGFSKSNSIILFFGNIRDYKGLDILITAFSNLDKNTRLIIAGNPWGSFEKYQNLINNLNIKERVNITLGFIEDEKTTELFKISDLVVFPYLEFEASSGAATIALNFGKAIVVTDVGGLPELVKDKKVIAKCNDPEDLSIKIQYALKNKKKLEKQSKEIAKKLSWNKIAEETLEVYGNEQNYS